MKIPILRKFFEYVASNYIGNFIGFAIGMLSTRLVAHFFTTRSIRNLWGLTAHKTVLDKKTYSNLEWVVALVVGFVVFELVSKWLKKKIDEVLPKYKLTQWMVRQENTPG